MIGWQGNMMLCGYNNKIIEQQSQNNEKVIFIQWQPSGTTSHINENHS